MTHWDVVPYAGIAALLEEREDVAARIVARAVEEVRTVYSREPDPAGLLPEPFTLLQLRLLHEAVLGEDLPKDTFRRRMEPFLTPLRATSTGTVWRPAQHYRRSR